MYSGLRHRLAILALIVPGCVADQMRFTAIRVAAQVPDVYQAQIMENLARTAANPGSMPYLSRLFNGTASTTDTTSLVASLTGQPHAFTSVNYGLSSFARGIQANIGIDPIDNPDKLAAMQIAYRKVVAPETVTPELYASCLGYLLTDPNPCVSNLPPPGWLQIGRRTRRAARCSRRHPLRCDLRLGPAPRSRRVNSVHPLHSQYRFCGEPGAGCDRQFPSLPRLESHLSTHHTTRSHPRDQL